MTHVKFDDLLPMESFAYHNITGEVIKIKKGESGYYSLNTFDYATANELAMSVDDINKMFNISKEQAEAMFQGSMFGWSVPASNPQLWKELFEEKGEIAFSHNKLPSWKVEEGE